MGLQTGFRAWMLRRWIKAKMKWSKIKRQPERELFVASIMFKDLPRVPNMQDLEALGIQYQPEFLLSIIPWDYQLTVMEVLKKKAADCNSLNRVVQMAALTKGYEAYLVTYWPDTGIADAHTTVILKSKNEAGEKTWVPCDYGYFGPSFTSPDECVSHIAEEYKCRPLAYVAQDWKWKFQKLK